MPGDPPAPGHTAEGVFVVHAHDARRPHFDLRLEAHGALLSFALPKGASLDPDLRLLAVRTEAHPLEYVDFEDTIPAGQYGAGPMIAWDRGLVRWLDMPAEAQLERGKLDFVLYGRKLRGRFALIPLKDKPSYLLMKKKDAFSSPNADLDPRSVFSGLLVADLPQLRAHGQALVTAARALPGVTPRATVGLRPRGTERATHWDFVPPGAFRALCTRRALRVLVEAEGGEPLGDFYPDLVTALAHAQVDDFVIEVLLWRDPQPELASSALPCQALVVDVLAVGDVDCTGVALAARRQLATQMFPGAGIVRSLPPFEGTSAALVQHARELGLAGILGRGPSVTFVATADQSLDAPRHAAPQSVRSVPAKGPRKLSLTNRQKPFFPGLTKGDLLDYYAAVAHVLIPHLRNRPVILERYPDGVDGKHFHQWRPPPSAPSWLGSVEIPEHRAGHVRDVGKDAKRAFVLDDVESLLYVANLGCIPLHLLAFEVHDPTSCTFATVDFDVKQASLDQARPLVRELRRLLDHAGLPAYLKTSGKTGLHVLMPLGPGIPFGAAQALVELLGRWLVSRHPATATREGSIDKRGARVYVDTGQTGTLRSIAAPYSVRPVQDARISMPVTWDQLDTLDPAEFTLRTVPALLATGDLWADFRVQKPDLGKALTRLQSLAQREQEREGEEASPSKRPSS